MINNKNVVDASVVEKVVELVGTDCIKLSAVEEVIELLGINSIIEDKLKSSLSTYISRELEDIVSVNIEDYLDADCCDFDYDELKGIVSKYITSKVEDGIVSDVYGDIKDVIKDTVVGMVYSSVSKVDYIDADYLGYLIDKFNRLCIPSCVYGSDSIDMLIVESESYAVFIDDVINKIKGNI